MRLRQSRRGAFSLSEILISSVIVIALAAIVIPTVRQSLRNSKLDELQYLVVTIQGLMRDIYREENPSKYPPLDVMPEGMIEWAAPTNLQNVQDLMDLLARYCKLWNELELNPNGSYRCAYAVFNPTGAGGETGGEPTPPPEDPDGEGAVIGEGEVTSISPWYRIVLTNDYATGCASETGSAAQSNLDICDDPMAAEVPAGCATNPIQFFPPEELCALVDPSMTRATADVPSEETTDDEGAPDIPVA